jgi:AAA domain
MSSSSSTKQTPLQRLAVRGREVHPAVETFRKEKILHRNFNNAMDEVAERIQYGDQQSMTAVIGPTSAGKTALVDEICHEFVEAAAAIPEEERTRLLAMELAAPEAGVFKWKDDLYLPGLSALNEPCINTKIDVEKIIERFRSGDCHPAFATQKLNIPQLRNLFFAGLARAKVIGVLMDEADHLRRPTSDSGIFQSYDSLKSRSNASPSHFVLFGTVLLTDIFKQSGQISKRVYPIWLAPYTLKEIDQFTRSLLAIEKKLPIKLKFSIEAKKIELFSDALGYMGLSHEQFDRALTTALDRGLDYLTWNDMIRARLHTSQLEGILNDTIQFMRVMKELDESLKEKRKIFFSSEAEAEKTVAPAVVNKPFQAALRRETVGP